MSPDTLLDPRFLAAQLELLERRLAAGQRRVAPSSQGLSLRELGTEKLRFCHLLARELRDGTFRLHPLRRTEVLLQGKQRVLYLPELVDAVVLGGLARRLAALSSPRLLDCVHGFRPGRSPWTALHRLRAYLHEHRAQRPEPRQRGLWVVQRDIAHFGESIPTHPESALWPLVAQLLEGVDSEEERQLLRRLLPDACRPTVLRLDGSLEQLSKGLPTGSPVQQPLSNYYLTALDERLFALEGGLYLRFGDDVLFAHAERAVAEQAAALLTRSLDALELSTAEHKSKDLYFTAPGRPCPAEAGPPWRPARHLEYLAARVDFQGTFGMKLDKQRRLLTGLTRRITHTARLGEREPATVIAALRGALDPRQPLADPLVSLLQRPYDDRGQLRHLDQLLRLRVAETLTGLRGVRAFRRLPPAALRQLGLPSLQHRRRRQ